MWNPFKPGLGHYYDVHVFSNIDDMHKYAKEKQIGRADWVGQVSPEYKLLVGKGGATFVSPKLGDVFLLCVYWFLSSAPDPHPASASKKQAERSLEREFVVLRHLPIS